MFGKDIFDAIMAFAKPQAAQGVYQPQGIFTPGGPNGWSWSPDSATAFEFTGTLYWKSYDGPLNPLHYLIQMPAMLFPSGAPMSGTCSMNGGCSF